ncbi:MAG: hypothetical protein IJ630_11215 [Treponema sp.]|nr:hypothetical protein [Treponema sp.]
MFATVSIGATFAAEGEGLGKYAKLTLGYSRGGVDTEWDFDSYKINYAIAYSGFEIIPTFGLELPVSALEKKNLSLALEGSLGLTFGSDSDGLWESSTKVIAPGVMGILNYHFDALPKLTPYAGLGFSVPIQLVNVKYKYTSYEQTGTVSKTYETDSTVVGFKINTSIGAKYAFTDKFSALGEFGMGIIGVFSWSIRAGAVYHF